MRMKIEKIETKTELRKHYSTLRASNKLSGTISAAMQKRERREASQAYTDPLERPLRERLRNLLIVEPPQEEKDQARSRAMKEFPRRRNWEGIDPTTGDGGVESVNNGRYSRSCTYIHWTYRILVRSCVAMTSGQLTYFTDRSPRRIKAPKGWQFGADALGAYVVRRNETRGHYRYHFVGDDLYSVSVLHRAALDHEKKQKQEKRQKQERRKREKIRERYRQQAIELGVYVSLHDSLRAGNCAAGSKRWATAHGLDVRKKYPAEVVRRIGRACGQVLQVERAIEAATDRARLELERGYCDLS